jgi:hypothetical protein
LVTLASGLKESWTVPAKAPAAGALREITTFALLAVTPTVLVLTATPPGGIAGFTVIEKAWLCVSAVGVVLSVETTVKL